MRKYSSLNFWLNNKFIIIKTNLNQCIRTFKNFMVCLDEAQSSAGIITHTHVDNKSQLCLIRLNGSCTRRWERGLDVNITGGTVGLSSHSPHHTRWDTLLSKYNDITWIKHSKLLLISPIFNWMHRYIHEYWNGVLYVTS